MAELTLQETLPITAGCCVRCGQEKHCAGHDCLAESLAQKGCSGPSAAAQISNSFWEWCFCYPSWLTGAEEGALRAHTPSSFASHRGMRSSMMSEESCTRFSTETQSMWQESGWWGEVTTHAATVSADLHTGQPQLREGTSEGTCHRGMGSYCASFSRCICLPSIVKEQWQKSHICTRWHIVRYGKNTGLYLSYIEGHRLCVLAPVLFSQFASWKQAVVVGSTYICEHKNDVYKQIHLGRIKSHWLTHLSAEVCRFFGGKMWEMFSLSDFCGWPSAVNSSACCSGLQNSLFFPPEMLYLWLTPPQHSHGFHQSLPELDWYHRDQRTSLLSLSVWCPLGPCILSQMAGFLSCPGINSIKTQTTKHKNTLLDVTVW